MRNLNRTYEVSVEDGYAAWAEIYDSEDNALIAVEEELTEPILSSISPTRVLDLGAGTGRHALRLAAMGAEVVALDQSDAMMGVAKENAVKAGLPIRFRHHSLNEPLPKDIGTFDLVLAALVLCHVEDLEHAAHEAYRVLNPGGHFLITDFHPAVIAAGWRTQFTNVDGTYFLPSARHSCDRYLSALQEAGFELSEVKETLVRNVPTAAFSPDLLNKDGDKPFCLVVLARKPE